MSAEPGHPHRKPGGRQSDLAPDKHDAAICPRRAAAYDARMAIFVEFYGVARRWAGVPNLRLELSGQQTTLRDVLQRLSDSAAASDGDEVCRGGALHPTLSANLDGNRFISDPATPIHDGQCLLILSADAGG